MSFTLQKALDLMQKAKDHNRFAHAYLITGPVGAGKESLAIEMIRMVNPDVDLGAISLDELRSSTTAVIGPESKSRRITVESVRGIEHTLQMAAPAGVTKFAVIKDADCMNEQAENAFLKTLEEPPAASRLLLLSSRPEALLDTILSRCMVMALAPQPGPMPISESARDLLDLLRRHAESGGGGVSAALGLMSRFSAILKEEKARIAKAHAETLKAEVGQYRNKTEGDYLKQREEHFSALTEAEYLEQRYRLLGYLTNWFGDAIRQQSGGATLDLPDYQAATQHLANQFSLDELTQRYDAVEELREHLSTNVLEGLALEVGFIRAFG